MRYSRGKAASKPVRISGRLLATFTLAASGSGAFGSILISPRSFSSSDVLDDLSDDFTFYRFTRMRVIIPPAANGAVTYDTTLACCWLPQRTASALADIEQIISCTDATVSMAPSTIPSEFTLTRQALSQTIPKWFLIPSGSTVDDFLEYQGALLMGNSSNVGHTVQAVVEYDIEFFGLLDQGVSPYSMPRPGIPFLPPTLPWSDPQWQAQLRQRALKRAHRESSTPHSSADLVRTLGSPHRDFDLVSEPSVPAAQLLPAGAAKLAIPVLKRG